MSYVTFRRASELSGLSVRQLQRYVDSGALTLYRLGKTRWVRLKKAEVARLFQAQPVKAPQGRAQAQ